MRIGVGLPAAVPGAPFELLGDWAAAAEMYGFRHVAALDRLVYDSLDPIVALATAAGRTSRVELITTILGVPYRRNAVVLAKQLASLDLVAAGRFVAGLALGGWPEDYAASDVALRGRGERFAVMLDTLRCVWAGKLAGAAGPMTPHPRSGPSMLLGALSPAGFGRVATFADGWIAPFFGLQTLRDGIASAREAWQRAGREGRPRVITERYFCLGPGADEVAGAYLDHYYGAEYRSEVLAETLTTPARLIEELDRIEATGCDDLLLFPCTADQDQLHRLVDALAASRHFIERSH
ncbi:LLM class flavin-dependent oxidoreductase [Microlunatus parietis]|uniref:Alkanesulfonate monooxygenase SsuD/methylene tetrahydromethanopterin reductase-like flavin-dependent oxidoreductase (Luciferase family) n=1 Tax=Microlunatus parietis TaxID=682979 RepID=A0A7Y9I4J8_9ACTN|nr:LLM class flavin-dependent oxidoreductase [Microlunatus parietis]NYE70147.1 alkanesulfonate monooxygenase SsuD/methylene tetrahydromethanopterin reductase-like flavin-dependent oxidoreductase (luciferase family) [Microlunatus parietis]